MIKSTFYINIFVINKIFESILTLQKIEKNIFKIFFLLRKIKK